MRDSLNSDFLETKKNMWASDAGVKNEEYGKIIRNA